MDWVDGPVGPPGGHIELSGKAIDNQVKREEPRRFQEGDRVRVNDSYPSIDFYLQEDNQVGSIVSNPSPPLYWIQMDKPVIKENSSWNEARDRPAVLPQGYAYLANSSELELIESVQSRRDFDIEEWRKNLKPGKKVRVMEDVQGPTFIKKMDRWRGSVVTLHNDRGYNFWSIKEDDGKLIWKARWFEPVRRGGSPKSRKTKESRKKALDPRLKNLIKTTSELFQTTEKTFKKTKEYPIFGLNLKEQESEVKTQRSNLGESLYSLGVVLYHLYTGESEHNNPSYLLDNYPKPKDMPGEFWKVVDKLLKSEYRSLKEFKEDLKRWEKALKQNNKDSP